MKKSYVKPQVYFENFQLSADIAKNCSESLWNKANHAENSCGYQMGNLVLFTSTIEGCSENGIITDGDNIYDNICYHGPVGNLKLFNS